MKIRRACRVRKVHNDQECGVRVRSKRLARFPRGSDRCPAVEAAEHRLADGDAARRTPLDSTETSCPTNALDRCAGSDRLGRIPPVPDMGDIGPRRYRPWLNCGYRLADSR